MLREIMVAIVFGLLAAVCWSTHDLLARVFAGHTGPFRMSFWIMLAGAVLLLVPLLWRGTIWQADQGAVMVALGMGLIYAFAMGALLLAFSLAPVSIVGPLTAGYPALVVVWGLFNGVQPTALQWIGILLIMVGVIIVGRSGHDDGGRDSVAAGKMPLVIASAVVASVSFAAAIVLGQKATIGLGHYEVTFISRFPAALVLLPMMLKERERLPAFSARAGFAVAGMALCDVIAVTAINASAYYPNKELGAMAIASYGAMSTVFAMVLLKERVMPWQWFGIALVVAGIASLGWPQN
jgi:drug/metabolite transporter (DMT)-like permease